MITIEKRLNPFQRYEDIDTSHLQIVYLYEVIKLTYKKIAEITGYAINTVKTYTRKFLNLLDRAKKIFTHGLGKLTGKDEAIQWEVVPNKNPCGYVLEFYSGDELLWLKVGMTERPLRQRIKEHLAYYGKKYENLVCKVKQIYEVSNHEEAEIVESALRDCYKRNYEKEFVKNDRFMGVRYKSIEAKDDRFNQFISILGAVASPHSAFTLTNCVQSNCTQPTWEEPGGAFLYT